MSQPPAVRPDSDSEIGSDAPPVFEKETALSLSIDHRRRVYAMRTLSQEYRTLRAAYIERLSEARRAELQESEALWARRREIVNGAPLTEAETARVAAVAVKRSTVEELPSDEDEKPKPEKAAKRVAFQGPAAGEASLPQQPEGIPNFWVTALQNSEATSNSVEERDVDALRKLTDIRVAYVDNDPRKGFVLSFYFAPNEYFTDEVLTKTYLYDREDHAALSFDDTLEEIKGCDIHWTAPAKKLTVMLKQRKQRHKSGKGTRVITREEDVPSFFHFFKAPAAHPEGDDDEDDGDDDVEEQMYEDYSVGEALAKSVVPRAVYYYTGKSIDEIAASLDFAGFDDDDEDEEEDEEEEEEEQEVAKAPPQKTQGKGPTRGRGGNAGKCEQQ